jgi:hypothetical protein
MWQPPFAPALRPELHSDPAHEHYFQVAKDEQPELIHNLDEAWFAPESQRRWEYLAAVAAGGN